MNSYHGPHELYESGCSCPDNLCDARSYIHHTECYFDYCEQNLLAMSGDSQDSVPTTISGFSVSNRQ